MKCCDDDMSLQTVKCDSELHTVQVRGLLTLLVCLMVLSLPNLFLKSPLTHIQSHHTPSDSAMPDARSVKATLLNAPETNAELLKELASYEELNQKLVQSIPAHATLPQTHMPTSSVLHGHLDKNPLGELAHQEGMASLRELSPS